MTHCMPLRKKILIQRKIFKPFSFLSPIRHIPVQKGFELFSVVRDFYMQNLVQRDVKYQVFRNAHKPRRKRYLFGFYVARSPTGFHIPDRYRRRVQPRRFRAFRRKPGNKRQKSRFIPLFNDFLPFFASAVAYEKSLFPAYVPA